MLSEAEAVRRRVLREWLQSEARLGVTHVGVALPDATTATRNPRPAGPAVRPADSREAGRPVSATTHRPARATAPPASRPSAPQAAPSPAGRHSPSGQATAPGQTALLPLIPDDPALPPVVQEALPAAAARIALEQLDAQHVRGCTRCGLHASRTQTVFGVGRVPPEVVFVGEGPGADEDALGEPFVGRAGQLLTRMIAAMTLTRESVYICNVVKCRPPGNRTPTEEEMRACAPFLIRQLALLRPKVIVALGRPAAQTLLQTTAAISQLRGKFHTFPPLGLASFGLPTCQLMPTFHPAYLLRNPPEKAKVWEDLKQVMSLLGLKVPP